MLQPFGHVNSALCSAVKPLLCQVSTATGQIQQAALVISLGTRRSVLGAAGSRLLVLLLRPLPGTGH